MSKRTNRTAAFAAAIALAVTAAGGPLLAADAPATQPTQPAAAVADFSTPKGAATAFASALLASDGKAARAASVGTPEQYDMIDAYAPVLASAKRMSDAAAKAYGPDNVLTKRSASRGVAAEMEGFDFKVDGDAATMVRKDMPNAANPMKLVKKDGAWKVDLSSLPQAEVAMAAQMAPALVKAADEVTADIDAKKYGTPDEAQQAFMTKVMGGLMQPPAKPKEHEPATGPATKPG